MSSSVPLVRAALAAQFAADLAASGDTRTRVTYGQPGPKVPPRFVAVASTQEGLARQQQTMPLRQTASRTEGYGLTAVIWVLIGKHDDDAQRQATEQAWSVFDVLDAGLRTAQGVTLGGIVTSALITRAVDDDFLLDEGRAAQIVTTITVALNRV